MCGGGTSSCGCTVDADCRDEVSACWGAEFCFSVTVLLARIRALRMCVSMPEPIKHLALIARTQTVVRVVRPAAMDVAVRVDAFATVGGWE